MLYEHFPVIAVMGCFLGAFLVEIFGAKSKIARNAIALIISLGVAALMGLLVKPVLIDKEIIVYWMGNWEPVSGWAIGIGYEIDALGLFFGLITALILVCSCLYSFRYMEKDGHLGHYYTLFLMLAGSCLGLFFSGDLFNIFIMIEIMTFSAVALTAFRNGKKGALEAAFRYLVVGTIGSSCVLLGTTLMYLQFHTLNLAQIGGLLTGTHSVVTILAFALLFVGYATKAFIFPFQPLAADAYATAPASVSAVFSGVVNKAGVYCLIRLLYTLFTQMTFDHPGVSSSAVQTLVVIFGILTMFVCVVMALLQHDFKRLLAFHSASQIGYVITAIGLGTAYGVSGGLFHALNHTLFKSLLFLTAGAVMIQAGTTNLDRLGGLSKKMPWTCAFFLVGAGAISGIPPFNGFASKWMIYQGTFMAASEGKGNLLFAVAGIFALLTSVLTLASFIKVTQSVFFGQRPARLDNVKEAPASMLVPMGILSALCLAAGLLPDLVKEYLLVPAATAAMEGGRYVQTAFGQGGSAGTVSLVTSGVWDPLKWILLLLILTAAAFLFNLFLKKTAPLKTRAAAPEDTDPKYDPFFSGEQSDFSTVGGSDLFWGFKKTMKKPLHVLESAHSGHVNDYALWAIVTLALVLAYALIFIF